MSERLSLEELQELEKLLLILEFAQPDSPVVAPAVPEPAETKEKTAKPCESKTAENEPPRGFIDRWCDKLAPGSDRPSGCARGKDDWMG
jgi:hypothetical protein